MIPTAELTSAVRGAFRLARFDSQGLNLFNRTLEGFWRSFFAAVLVGPLQLLLNYELATLSGGELENWLPALAAFAVQWLAFPVVMLTIADWLDRRDRYFTFMVAFNWSSVPQVVLQVVIYALAVGGFFSAPAAQLLGAAAMAYILVYEWYIAKLGLDIPGGKAVAVVALDLLLAILIASFAAFGQQ